MAIIYSSATTNCSGVKQLSIFKEEVNPSIGLTKKQCENIANNLDLKGDAHSNMCDFINNLYIAYHESDASLFEINPVIKASDDKIIAVDAKVSLDENASFRHPENQEIRKI